MLSGRPSKLSANGRPKNNYMSEPITKRSIIFLVSVIALAMLVTIYVQSITYVAPHRLSPDAYPLFPALSWKSEQPGIYDDIRGYQALSIPLTNLTDIASATLPFETYYAAKLKGAGWLEDKGLDAGGPGSELTAYKNTSGYIVVGYTSAFHAGGTSTPEECPCDVTFNVFSGSIQ